MKFIKLLLFLSVFIVFSPGCGSCGKETAPDTVSAPNAVPTPIAAAVVPFNHSFASDTQMWNSSNPSQLMAAYDSGQGSTAVGSIVLSSPGDNASSGAKLYRAMDMSNADVTSGIPGASIIQIAINLDGVDPLNATQPTVLEYVYKGIIMWRLEITGSGVAAVWRFNGSVLNCAACPTFGFLAIQVVFDTGVLNFSVGGQNLAFGNTNMGGLAATGYPVTTGFVVYGGDGFNGGAQIFVDDFDIAGLLGV